jgi:hypothetical protein
VDYTPDSLSTLAIKEKMFNCSIRIAGKNTFDSHANSSELSCPLLKSPLFEDTKGRLSLQGEFQHLYGSIHERVTLIHKIIAHRLY